MLWSWQDPQWPDFQYEDASLQQEEAKFLRASGMLWGSYQHISENDKSLLTVDLISNEALKTSEIEGEYLNRESVQSSIRNHFGLATDRRKAHPAEAGISEMMMDLYHHFNRPLSHETLFHWHSLLTNGRWDLTDVGHYRTHLDPMQIVSGPIGRAKIHYEAPPSQRVVAEMDRFIAWFNETAPAGKNPLPALARSGIAHLYFELIHPFEDGNGRIGRALAEKALSQSLQQPTLIALSHRIQIEKKAYYHHLEQSDRSLEINAWLKYFAQTILSAQEYTQSQILFLIAKTKFYDHFREQLNDRQAKVIARLFEEGPAGFKGGLSAENYIRITGTSRATATRDLQDLVSKKVFTQSGVLKGVRYQLNLK